LLMLHAFAQSVEKDSATYASKPLKVDEINLVSSYYTQNGDHSAITGGIGTERVVDLANGIDVKWVGFDKNQRKHSLTATLGIDHHSSASSAFVNKSGASKTGGTRVYPPLTGRWKMPAAAPDLNWVPTIPMNIITNHLDSTPD